MRIPIAREGYPLIASTAIPAIVLLDAALLWGGLALWSISSVLVILALCVIFFFRDPARHGPEGHDLVLAPADGKVIEISFADEDSYLKKRALKVSIFLSLFDVHVNRYPVSGQVQHRDYAVGRFQPAWRGSASHSNERASTGINGNGHALLVRQIAGLAARRIVTYAEVGDEVRQGERMGMIRFGSRVDVFLPEESNVAVEVGQRARGALTVLARLPATTEPPA